MQKIIFFICFVILFCIVFFCITKYDNKKIKHDNWNFYLNTEHLREKENCNIKTTYCFDNNDCLFQCDNTLGSFNCIKGICNSNINNDSFEEIPQITECDPHKGIIALLLGNIGWSWEWVCKSIDPAIALENGDNKMCKNGDIVIDYLNKFPSISDCENCKGEITVPATKNKRRHVECNEKYSEFVNYN